MHATEFRAVPFDDNWIVNDKIDVHAIYRRPVLSDVDGQQLADDYGVPRWDLTGGLPVNRHLDWLRKGFEYVTLADASSLANAAASLRARGLDPRHFIMLRNRLVGPSPWNPKLYLETQPRLDRQQLDKLRAMVEQVGSSAVLEILRLKDPYAQLPPQLQDIPPGGPAAPPLAAPSESDLTVEYITAKRPTKHRARREAAARNRR
jgi:hypothetical protein